MLRSFNDEAVLDKETGLVWEKLAGDTNEDQVVDNSDRLTWVLALAHCYNKDVGDRKGWRLPTVEELASLVDPTVPIPGPTLPAGHPFDDVQSHNYWTATTNSSGTTAARNVAFQFGVVSGSPKSAVLFVWCVRGGQGHDGQ